MVSKLFHTGVIILLFQGLLFSHNKGSIKGVIIDNETNEAMIGASVWVSYNDSLIGVSTDLDGKYNIKLIPTGTYTLNVSFIGKVKHLINNITVKPDKISFIDTIRLRDDDNIITCSFPVFWPYDRLLDPEDPSRTTLDENQIKTMAGARNPNTLLTQASDGAITTSADGEEVYFRGSRDGSFITYFDGMKIEGKAPSVPMAALKSYSVYTGGLPAKYGDTSGGVVVIETKSFFDLYNQKVAQMGITYK
jgi:hypothetical protein